MVNVGRDGESSSKKPTKFGLFRQIFQWCQQKMNLLDFIFQRVQKNLRVQIPVVFRGTCDKKWNVPLLRKLLKSDKAFSLHTYLNLEILFQLEIYDPVVDSTQNTAKQAEEPVTEMEQKVSVARKFVWGWTSKVKVSNGSGQVSCVGFSCVESGELGKMRCQINWDHLVTNKET